MIYAVNEKQTSLLAAFVRTDEVVYGKGSRVGNKKNKMSGRRTRRQSANSRTLYGTVGGIRQKLLFMGGANADRQSLRWKH